MKKELLPLFTVHFLFPLLAAFLVTFANSFTGRLFLPIENLPFGSGLHLPAVILVLSVLLLGVLADRSWRRFFEISIPLCSVMLLLSPSLLLFERGETLFYIIYTLNSIVSYFVWAFLPFVIVDLYWQSTKVNGYWAWFLAISVYVIRSNSKIQAGLFRDIPLDNVYAVILLSLTGVVFYLLCRKFLSLLPEAEQAQAAAVPITDSSASLQDIFKEHGFSNRETEVASLLVNEGLSNEEIGKRLFISSLTVRDHVSQIYRKFNVKSRVELMTKFVGK